MLELNLYLKSVEYILELKGGARNVLISGKF